MRWVDGSRGTHHLAGDRDGDEDLLPRLRHVGHRQPGLAGRARRVEAGAAAYPLRHVRPRGAPGQSAQEERAHRRGRYGALPPARRRAHLRIPGADGAGLVLPLPADRPAGELRLRRWRSRRGDEVYGSPALRLAMEMLADIDKETVDFVPNF